MGFSEKNLRLSVGKTSTEAMMKSFLGKIPCAEEARSPNGPKRVSAPIKSKQTVKKCSQVQPHNLILTPAAHRQKQ